MPLVDIQSIFNSTHWYVHFPIFIVVVSVAPLVFASIFLNISAIIFYFINWSKIESNSTLNQQPQPNNENRVTNVNFEILET